MKPGPSEPAHPDTGMPAASKIFYFIERCPMKPLLSALNDIPEYRSLLSAIDGGACPAALSGLSAVHRAHFAAGIRQELGRPVVVVCADEGEAERMARDLAALSGEEGRTLSAREFTFHNAAVVSRQYEHRRLSTLRALAAG